LAIGDYQIAFGQGLTMWSGLSFGKSGSSTDIIKFGQGLKPSASVNESRFLRGGAFTLKFKTIDFTLFYSNKRFDGNVTVSDSLSEEGLIISSMQETGLHRTVDALLDKAVGRQVLYGGHFSYHNKLMQFGYTAQQSTFKSTVQPALTIYNQFSLLDMATFNQGIDFKVFLPKVVFFGEISKTQLGGMAAIAGLTAQPISFARFTLSYRNYAKNYRNFHSTGFGENTATNNEKGIYVGLSTDISPTWKLTAYADYFKFPWLRYQSDAPSFGHDYYVQFDHRINRNDAIYIRFRTKTKMSNQNNPWDYIDFPIEYTKTSLRFHVNYKVSNSIEFKDRIEIIQYHEFEKSVSQGFLLYHDILFKPATGRHELSFRFAIFDAASYDSRLYAYENDVLYAFSIPSFSDKGSRVYLLYRLNISKSIDLWFRIAQTWYANKTEIGSGTDLIDGNKKTDVKVQIRWKF